MKIAFIVSGICVFFLVGCQNSQTTQPKTPPPITTSVKEVKAPEPVLPEKKKDENFCMQTPVFMYHHMKPSLKGIKDGVTKALSVSTQTFDDQMKYLVDNGYKTIKAEDLVEAIINNKELDKKTIVLTFDDGYEDIYTEAFPIAKKYNVILNAMIITDSIGKPDYMTWDQLKEMKKSGLVYLYNHTKTHPTLAKKTDDEIKIEATEAQSALEKNLGTTYPLITYPYGTYSERVIRILKENGFKAGFSTLKGITQCEKYIFKIQRKRIGELPLNKYGF